MIFPARDFKFFERFGLLFFLKMRLLYWLWCLFVRRYFQSETWWPKGSIYFYNKPLPSLCPSLTSSFLTGPSHLQHVSHHFVLLGWQGSGYGCRSLLEGLQQVFLLWVSRAEATSSLTLGMSRHRSVLLVTSIGSADSQHLFSTNNCIVSMEWN